jgi:alkylhydroperoxidase family enzyme
MTAAGFLAEAPASPAADAMYAEDLDDPGFVMNASRLWAYQPRTCEHLFALMSEAFAHSGLTFRHRALLVLAMASSLGDSYCSLAWGDKLAKTGAGAEVATVLTGRQDGLAPEEVALVAWARRVVSDPNGTSATDVQALRDAGLSDQQIFAVTVFVSLRLAFSTVNDALGASPDRQLLDTVPQQVAAAVTYGRPAG